MKRLSLIVLGLPWAAAVFGADQPLSGPRLEERSSDELRFSSITLSIRVPPGSRSAYPAPTSVMFLERGAETEPVAVDSGGVPLTLAFPLMEENLAWIRGALNDELSPVRIDRFASVRLPGSRQPRPDYPEVAKRPEGPPPSGGLEIRATSVYRDAHYIIEFIVIESAARAAVFLEHLAKRFEHAEISPGLQRLADNLMRGEESRRTAPRLQIPAPSRVAP